MRYFRAARKKKKKRQTHASPGNVSEARDLGAYLWILVPGIIDPGPD